ncbi:hypothetical protein, partial [Anabaena azotica]
ALELETKKADGHSWKYRKITDESWKQAQMYLAHKEAIKATQPVIDVAAVPQVDPIVPILAEELAAATTREECENLFMTVTEQQKNEAWAILSDEQQQKILALYEPQVIQPSIFDQPPVVEAGESSAVSIDQPPVVEAGESSVVSMVNNHELVVNTDESTVTSQQLPVNSHESIVNSQQQIDNPVGHRCWVWHFSEWKEAIIQTWEYRPHEKFFKSAVSFIDNSFTRLVWVREAIFFPNQQ